MHIFNTNKVPRVVLEILWIGTRLGEKWSQRATRARHGLTTKHGRPLQVRPALPGAAGPAMCHVHGPKHFLPRVHNLDERDLSKKCRFDRMDELVITWINGSTSPADQPPQPSFQEHPERHQAKAVHPTA
jgi:hypothetical protein